MSDRPCNFHVLKNLRDVAESEGQTVTVIAVGDRNARHADRFKEGPVNVFIDGKLSRQFPRYPRECGC